MNFFDTVTASLTDIDENIFYGAADPLNKWDYIVLQKEKMVIQKGSKGLAFSVVVVRENYIEDSIPDTVISAVTSIRNVRQNGDVRFEYSRKNNTNVVVELAYIPFIKIGSAC